MDEEQFSLAVRSGPVRVYPLFALDGDVVRGPTVQRRQTQHVPTLAWTTRAITQVGIVQSLRSVPHPGIVGLARICRYLLA